MLSVVVPCYNEEKNLPLLVERFADVLKGKDAELVLVNNGSTDNSPAVINDLVAMHSFIRCATVSKNVGYGHGILTGLSAAQGDILAYTHADLQCEPSDVIKAYNRLLDHGSRGVLVKGNREGRSSLLTSLFHLVAAILFFRKFDDINGQPKVFHRDLLKKFTKPPYGFQFDFYVQYKALQNGYKVVSIPVTFGERKHGESKWATSLQSKVKNALRFLGYILRLRLLGE